MDVLAPGRGRTASAGLPGQRRAARAGDPPDSRPARSDASPRRPRRGRAARSARLAAVAILAALLPGAAAAEERPDRAFQLTPYVWATGVGGTARPFAGAPVLDVDASFGDLLEDLDAAFFLSGYARAERFVLVTDFSYASSSRGGVARVPGLGPVPAEGRLRQTSFTLVSGYRVVDDPRVTLDLLAGARAWRIRADVELAGGALSRSPGLDFVDPIVAARANLGLGSGWSTILYGDVGGFGAGSDRTWQGFATLNYQISGSLFLSAGYRFLSVDYDSGGTAADLRLGGPIVGVTYRF